MSALLSEAREFYSCVQLKDTHDPCRLFIWLDMQHVLCVFINLSGNSLVHDNALEHLDPILVDLLLRLWLGGVM